MTRTKQLVTRTEQVTHPDVADEPPVIARLVVEIRSDGRRTIARGTLEDRQRGERTAVEVEAGTLGQLAFALAKALFQAPLLGRSMAKALLGGHKGDAADEMADVPPLSSRRTLSAGETRPRRVKVSRGQRRRRRRKSSAPPSLEPHHHRP